MFCPFDPADMDTLAKVAERWFWSAYDWASRTWLFDGPFPTREAALADMQARSR